VHLIARLAAGGMRDAESMLDQLLSSSTDELDEVRVRDLLGLADAETITGFVNALVGSDALAGIRLLDALEERGRDLRGFLDQVIETLRAGIVGAAATKHPVAALAAAARRLAAIDPSRAGVGGLRLQLELALFPDAGAFGSLATQPDLEAVAKPAPPAVPTPKPPKAATPATVAEPAKVVEPDAAGQPTPAATATGADQPSQGETATPTAKQPKGKSARQAEIATAPPDVAAASPANVAAAPPANVSAATPTGDLATLRDRWAEVVARISANPPAKPLIVECRPISAEDGVVTLGFPESKAFLRDLLEKRRPILEENISAVLGHSVAVRCVATNIDVLPDLPTDDEAAWILAEARRIFGEENADPAEVG
jgi:DNA polymerase-3 subunit gamma/tau